MPDLRESLLQQTGAFWAMVNPAPNPERYFNVADFVLDRGKVYPSQALTELEMHHVLTSARIAEMNYGPFEAKQCFNNAARLVMHDPSDQLVYCEGQAFGSVLATAHAWVVLNGKVVDLTWQVWEDQGEAPYLPEGHRYRDNIIGLFGDNRAYLGVEIPKADLFAHRRSESSCASVIDNWYDEWPLLQQPRLNPIPNEWLKAREAFQALTNKAEFDNAR